MENPIKLTFADVVESMPEVEHTDELVKLLREEEPTNSYSRRTIFLLIGSALAFSARLKSEA
jgi:hypothetical protein